MSGPALALLSSLAFGVADFVGGTASRRVGALQILFFSQWIQLGLAAVWVVLSAERLPDPTALAAAIGAGLGITVSAFAFFQAMVVGKLSVVTPIAATGVVLPVVVGIAGGEHPSAAQVVGIIAAMAGVAFVARSQEEQVSTRAESGISLALVAAIGLGLFLWLMAPAGRQATAWSVFIVRAIPAVVLSAVVYARRTPLRSSLAAGMPTRILAVGVLAFAGIALYGLATAHGQLMIVSVLGSLWPAIVVLLAYRFVGERLAGAQRFGVVFVFGAVVLLST